jgi:hypothetical protein
MVAITIEKSRGFVRKSVDSLNMKRSNEGKDLEFASHFDA